MAPSVAVVDLGEGRAYSFNGTVDYNLLSVAKLPILLATVEAAQRDARPLRADERQWLDWMISVSDNDATEYLWENLAGTDAVDTLFAEAGLRAPLFVREDRWGTMRASALDLATLLAAAASGAIVAEETQRSALALLDRVEDWQRWGVNAGLDDACACLVRLKNGWFEVDEGWWLRSAGIVYGADGRAAYTLVVMTDAAASFAEGVATIEAIAREIHLAERTEARLLSVSPGE